MAFTGTFDFEEEKQIRCPLTPHPAPPYVSRWKKEQYLFVSIPQFMVRVFYKFIRVGETILLV